MPAEAVRIVLPLLILAAGFAAFAAIGSRGAPPTKEPTAVAAPLVETVAVEPHEGGLTIDTDGLVVPFRQIDLSAEVGGRIVSKSPGCNAGRYVTKGELLIQIDPRRYELEVERLNKELKQAEATLAELDVEVQNTLALVKLAEEQVQLQQRELARTRQLSQQRVATESDLEAAQRNELTARNNLLTLRNQVQTLNTRRSGLQSGMELVQARLDQAQLDLAHTEVRAPIDGVIYSDHVEQDSYVQPGTLLVEIEDTSAVEVKCSLMMDELAWLWSRQGSAGPTEVGESGQINYQLPRVPATVRYKVGDRQFSWQGVLNRFEGVGLDEKTRTIPCRVLVADPTNSVTAEGERAAGGPRALIRGMFVSVQIQAAASVSLLRVPERAVRPGSTVWRVRDSKLEIVQVPVAQILDDVLLVRADASDIRAGDQVVVSPLSAVSTGMPVRVAPPTSVAAAEASGR